MSADRQWNTDLTPAELHAIRCMKPDEVWFFLKVAATQGTSIRPRHLINSGHPECPHHKRAWMMLEKWAGRGWYDSGVTDDLGWLTERGKAAAVELARMVKERAA